MSGHLGHSAAQRDRDVDIYPVQSSWRKAGERMEWMDALRGLAVLCVVVQHYFWNDQSLVGHFLDMGVIGVVSFFCISGYIIPWSVLKRHVTAFQFVRLRFFRLYPSYWVALLLAAVTMTVAPWHLAVNVTMFQRFLGAPDALGVFWTLQIELLFYAGITVLLISGRLKQPGMSVGILFLLCCAGLVLAAGRYFLHVRTPVAPAFGLIVMFSSLVFFFHRAEGFLSPRRVLCLLSAVAIFMAVSLYLAYSQDWGYRETPSRYLVSYAVGFSLFALFQYRNVRPWLLQWIGRISYPLYLLHIPIQVLISRALEADGVVVRMVAVPVAIAGAALVHYYVEVPGSRLVRGHVAA